jgi:predicted RNA binding protein YcfA (HicA-like mRNA interferase family)
MKKQINYLNLSASKRLPFSARAASFTSPRTYQSLQRAGFNKIRQKGSHIRLRHPDGRVVTVPIHGGKDISRGLLRKIIRDAEWSVEDFQNFLKK